MDIIIVGAGIAGLGAGVALRKAGHRVKILEQSSLTQEVGAAITIKPNASRVLKSWDFSPEKSGMVAIRKGSLIDGTNMNVLIPSYYKDCEKNFGSPMYAVHRVDLHSQLKDLATCKDGPGIPCELEVKRKIVDYDPEHGTCTTESGEVLRADLIVAADGVHSKAVRHVIDEDIVQSGDTGWSCMRWLVPREKILADPATAHMIEDSSTRYFTSSGGAAGLVWYPCRDNKVQNFLYLSKEFDTSHVGEDFRAHVEPSVPLGYAQKHFAPALQTVVEKAEDVKFWKLISRAPIPKWHKDRLVLIGDAAHPMLTFQGQGGGQAIEDAAALGVLFDQIEDRTAVENRLLLFEQVRRCRGAALQILSSTNPPASQALRDQAASYLPDGKTLNSTDEINEYVFSFDVIAEAKKALIGA